MALAILRKMLQQKAVYWGNVRNDGGGDMTSDLPVEVSVRWQDMHVEFLDASGRTKVSKAKVFVASLDGGVREGADMEEGGYLQLTTLVLLGSNLDLVDNLKTASKIESYGKMPSLKADEFLRTAML